MSRHLRMQDRRNSARRGRRNFAVIQALPPADPPAPPADPTDPDFASVVLLLDFAGDDAATDITDLSNRGHVETFVADAEVDTALQVLGNNSILFDGTGDKVTVANSADWDFLLQDFTMEFHVRFSASTGDSGLVGAYNGASGGAWVGFNGTADELRFGDGDTVLKAESWTPVNDTWYHIAVARKADVIYMFVDGTELGTGTADTTDFTNSSVPLSLGMLIGTTQPLAGSLANVRITKGIGRYDTAFTAPTAAYGAQGPAAAVDDDFASVVLLLDWAGADAGQDTTDLSNTPHTDSWTGTGGVIDDDIQHLLKNTFLSDGASTYVTFPDHADWDFGTADFTVEVSFRLSSFSNKVLIGNYDAVSEGWNLQLSTTGPSVRWYNFDLLMTFNHSMTVNKWTHLAISRSGTTTKMFIDGAEVDSITDSSDYSGSAKPLTVGALASAPTTQGIVGNMGAIRVTKGVARYTGAFTPPTEFFPTS